VKIVLRPPPISLVEGAVYASDLAGPVMKTSENFMSEDKRIFSPSPLSYCGETHELKE
jgi:hypothetical protein